MTMDDVATKATTTVMAETSAQATVIDAAAASPSTTPLLSQECWTLLSLVLDSEWKAMFLVLAQFRRSHGHVQVAQTDNPALALWLQRQFITFRNFLGYFSGSPSATTQADLQTVFHKLQLLRLLGLKMTTTQTQVTQSPTQTSLPESDNKATTVSKRKAVWEANLDALREYRDQYGHCDPKDNINLKRWADRQRKRLKGLDTKAAPLQEDEIRRLQDVGVAALTQRRGPVVHTAATGELAFRSSAPKNLKDSDRFDSMYEEMRKFYEENGHTVVSQEKNPRLRAFLVEVRNEYKKLKATGLSPYLTPVRMDRLQQINFSFEARPKFSFEERITQWVAYRTQHGKDPPATTSLGKWVTKQRLRYHDTKDQKLVSYTTVEQHYLSDEQIAKLEAVAFEFGQRDYSRVVKPWDERFAELVAFKEEHGHCDVPQRYPGLGEWVHHQRTRHLKMRQDQKDQLDAIGFKWLTRARPTKSKDPPVNIDPTSRVHLQPPKWI